MVRNVISDDRAGSDQCPLADRHTRDDRRVGTDGGRPLDTGRLNAPIRFALRGAVWVGGARIAVIGKHHAMADEHLVLNDHTFANKCMRGNLAPRADRSVLLNFDERADPGLVTYAAAVEIDLVWMIYLDVAAKHHRIRNRHLTHPLS